LHAAPASIIKVIASYSRFSSMPVIERIAAYAADLTAIRRDLHQYPEIGFEEVRTSGIVADMLDTWGIDVHRGIGKTGVVGILNGNLGEGRTSACVPTWMPCPWRSAPTFPMLRKTPAGSTAAVTTGTRRCCSGPRAI